jgi:hypothetical protein
LLDALMNVRIAPFQGCHPVLAFIVWGDPENRRAEGKRHNRPTQ